MEEAYKGLKGTFCISKLPEELVEAKKVTLFKKYLIKQSTEK